MELTQRLECTQENFSNISERICPEQIGFLGICGTKYPVKRGPNKIGRDPQTCNIVLNLNSISRQHAVLNVLDKTEYMLMDLDSANKTKLEYKTLQPYIPHPIKNGDTVQFGQVFGVFRLLEDDTDLPMTQALDIPDTPISGKFISKLNHITTVPESPDVSDKDDSFIAPSQPKNKDAFKSPTVHMLKSSGRIISIQPIGQRKIDNVFWKSSKKSDSFNLQNSQNESLISVKSSDASECNIHELETQVPNQSLNSCNNVSIYDAVTQVPDIESERPHSPDIYSMETQLPTTDKDICKTNGILENNSLHGDNKENGFNVLNADIHETNFKTAETEHNSCNGTISAEKEISKNSSDDIILFDDLDDEPLEENFESQAILPPSPMFPQPMCKASPNSSGSNKKDESITIDNQKSDAELVCDDLQFLPTQVILARTCNDKDDIHILPTQKIRERENEDDGVTDCEDELECNENIPKATKSDLNEDVTDCEDNVEDDDFAPNREVNKLTFEELETQVLDEDVDAKKINENEDRNQCNIEDMLTQVIPEVNEQDNIQDVPTQIIAPVESKPNTVLKQLSLKDFGTFKVPVQSPKKQRKKAVSKSYVNIKPIKSQVTQEDNYYAATQELLEDLCTQADPSGDTNKRDITDSVQIMDRSFESVEGEDKIEQFVSALSSQEIRDVVGVDKKVNGRRIYSDSSDVEVTPKKITPFKIMEMDLPNSQEIKTSVTMQSKVLITESSSDSDTENDTRENTPILFKPKKRVSKEAKQDLTKKFDAHALPSRIITRTRKPTDKLLNSSDGETKSILKCNFITEQEEDVNADIINENISKLKSEKSKASGKNTKISKESRKSQEKTVSKTSKFNDLNGTNEEAEKEVKAKVEKIKEKHLKQTEKANSERTTRTRKAKNEDNTKTNEDNSVKERKSGSIEPRIETRGRKRNTLEDVRKTFSPIGIDADLPEKRRRVKRMDVSDISPEKELRRSRRNRNKNEGTIESKNKRTLIKHEQSTVYNESGGTDSPILKRTASKELFVPAKRGRPPKVRKVETQRVLFTAFPCDEVKSKLEKLGAIIVSDIKQCTVVLTLHIKRTFKLLCALGLGRPVVGPHWVQACVDSNAIVDPWLHLIKDTVTENNFQFDLHKTLTGKRNFLKGCNISTTPSVLPAPKEMKLIVECSGGNWKEGGNNWIVISSLADKLLWPQLKQRGAQIVSTEFILGGVLRQKLEVDRYRLA